MGIEFRLGRLDHKKVEDFLHRGAASVRGISLDASNVDFQLAAADAAKAAGIAVFVDPLTERLADEGFEQAGLSYYRGRPIDLSHLGRSREARRGLVEDVLERQRSIVTHIVPPHFFVSDDRSMDLNLLLVRRTALLADHPLRPILLVQRKFGFRLRSDLADGYADAGVEEIELRVSPFGGEDESALKIESVFAICDAFHAEGIRVVLGCSGNIGQSALALGHADGYSVGIGMKEHVDHVAAIGRQRRQRDDDDDRGRFGPQSGVYLLGLEATVPRRVASDLLSDRGIRGRLSCGIGRCANDINGPATDPREHYLHARAHQVSELLARPVAWRANMELDRLRRALELREIVNSHHLPPDTYPLKVRTLRSLLDDIEREQRRSA